MKQTCGQLLILNQNIRSIDQNYEELLLLINSLTEKPDIIICTETWKFLSLDKYAIDGYKIYHNNSVLNKADGVIVYVSENIKAVVSVANLGNLKVLEVEVESLDNEKVLVTGIYRLHQTKKETFNKDLEKYLKVHASSKVHYVFGDINIDTLQVNEITEDYKGIYSESGYLPLINSITRPNVDQGSCIDHIFAKEKLTTVQSKAFILHNNITDHHTTLLKIDLHKQIIAEQSGNNKKNINFNKLIYEAQKIEWDNTTEVKDVDALTDNLVNNIKKIIEKSIFNKANDLGNKNVKPRKAWITKGLSISCNKKQDLYNKLRRDPHNINLNNKYKNYCKHLKIILKKAKNNYDKKVIESHKKDSRKLWNYINTKIGKKKKKSVIIEKLNVQGNCTQDKKKIANHMNHFFNNIGNELASKITKDKSFNYTEERRENSLFFTPVSQKEISTIINKLKKKAAGGIDNISSSVLQKISPFITNPLTKIINKCFEEGVCPRHFKQAEIIPIYKSGDKFESTNYRPISLIPNLAKIFEKAVKCRLNSFFKKYNIINKEQFGFVEKKSTTDALGSITEHIYNNLDKSKPTIAIFLDLAKAFDTVNHEILLRKLNNIGVRGNANKLIRSYLTDRTQVVKIKDETSSQRVISCGVPQGSILGPLLFIVYMNDIFSLLKEGKLIAFADDTVLISEGATWDEVQNLINKNLKVVFNWLCANELSLNITKTVYMTFVNYKDKLPENLNIEIIHNSQVHSIERVKTVKYLGVLIDESLKWSEQIKAVLKKTRYLTYVLNKLKNSFNIFNLKLIYNAFFSSIASYGIIAWGCAYENVFSYLEKYQDRLLKIIFGKSHDLQEICKTNLIPKVRQMYYISSVLCEYKNLQQLVPKKQYNTRFKQISLLNCKLEAGKKSYKYTAILVFNLLPNEMKMMNINRTVVTKNIRRWIIQNLHSQKQLI